MRGLVSPRISQQPVKGIQVFEKGLRFKSRCNRPRPTPVPPDRTKIHGFSENSRRRLRFVAVNAFPELISTFVLTYHNDWPLDGQTSKQQLNAFLVTFRRKFPGHKYLWLLEFQKRGAPHYHFYFDLEVTPENQKILCEIWCRLIDPERQDMELRRFHSKAMRPWTIGNGQYLAKYLEKERQKDVPENYENVGRFWGASRGLVPLPVEIDYDEFSEKYSQVDEKTGEVIDGLILAQRWLGRWYEKQFSKGKGRKIRRNFRIYGTRSGFTMVSGAKVFYQIEKYLAKQSGFYEN